MRADIISSPNRRGDEERSLESCNWEPFFLHYFHRGILSLGNVLNNSVAEEQQNLITRRLCTRLSLLPAVTKI